MRLPFILAALLLLALAAVFASQRRVRGRFMAAFSYALFALVLLGVAFLDTLARYRPVGWWVLGAVALLVLLRGIELSVRMRRR
ncbi:MAG TPA: hypothetical protein VF832_18520 [Longimicrobiales bacterium]